MRNVSVFTHSFKRLIYGIPNFPRLNTLMLIQWKYRKLIPMISETARFILTLVAAALCDTYVLWNVQDASHIFFAIGVNLIVIINYCISYEIRSNDVSRDRSRRIWGGVQRVQLGGSSPYGGLRTEIAKLPKKGSRWGRNSVVKYISYQRQLSKEKYLECMSNICGSFDWVAAWGQPGSSLWHGAKQQDLDWKKASQSMLQDK
jgi:hypothetical protein